MPVRPRPPALSRLALAAATLALAAPSPARAVQPEECPLFLPDLRCERSGRYEGFVMPMTSPFLFEDPFITTGIYTWAVWHDFPETSVFRGGDLRAYAVQARLAITDRVAFIATKDGYVDLRPDLDLLDSQQGFFDLSAGFKVALIDMPERQLIVSPSLRFDVPTGSDDVLSGNGNGVAIPALSAAWGAGGFHWIGDLGGRLPFDGEDESTSLFYHLHVDRPLLPRFVPFVELSGLHWTDSGDGSNRIRLGSGARVPIDTVQDLLGTGRFEGADVVNLGSSGVAGDDLLTVAVGARFPVHRHVSLGVAYERPITEPKGIYKQRVTANASFEF